MSTTTPDTTPTTQPTTVILPTGWAAGAGRETSQVNPQGQIVQGQLIPLTSPTGGQITVFIPYSVFGNIAQMQALFDARINGLAAIPGQT